MSRTPLLLAPTLLDAFLVCLLGAVALWLCWKRLSALTYSLLERRLLLLGLAAILMGGLALGLVTWRQWLPTDDSLNFYWSALYLKQLTLEGHPDAWRIWTLPPWGFAPDDILATHRLNMLALDSVHHVAFVKVLTVLLLSLGSSYYGSAVVLGCVGFNGLWALYDAFRAEMEGRKWLAICLLLGFPSVLFWSGGVMKEPMLLAGLGWGIWSAKRWMSGRKPGLGWVLWTCLAVVLAFTIKPFLIQALILALAGVWMLAYLLQHWRSLRTWGVVLALLAGAFLLMHLTSYTPERILGEMRYYQIALEAKGVKGNSSFDIGWDAPYAVSDGLLLLPWAMFTGLFRPFLWETANMAGKAMALEALVQLLVCAGLLWQTDWRRLWQQKDALAVWAGGFLVYAVLSAGFLGLTLQNFGTLVRYRIVLLPFLWLGLLMLPRRRSGSNSSTDISG